MTLGLPLPGDTLQETAIALQGLLLYDHYKHWKFPRGGTYLRVYAKLLDRWSQEVLSQLRQTTQSGAAWDPVPAAVELLAIGARLVGRPNARDANLADQVSALFLGLDSVEISSRSPAWAKVFNAYKQYREALVNIVQARVACAKGGSSRVQFVDGAQLATPLRATRAAWRPQAEIPADIKPEFRPLKDFRAVLDQFVEAAIQEEKARHLAWLDRVVAELGENLDRPAIIKATEAIMQKAKDAGVYPNNYRENLPEVIEKFRRAQLSQCLEGLQRIKAETDPAQQLRELGRNYQSAMQAADSFIKLFNEFAQAVTRRVESDIANSPEAADLEATLTGIDNAFGEVAQLMTVLAGDSKP